MQGAALGVGREQRRARIALTFELFEEAGFHEAALEQCRQAFRAAGLEEAAVVAAEHAEVT